MWFVRISRWNPAWVAVLVCAFICNESVAQDLQGQLLQADLDQLCQKVTEKGRVKKGAELFASARLTCIQCHNLPGPQLAPSLSIPTRKFANKKQNLKFVIDSILQPSKHIADGYQTGMFLTGEGEVLTGLLKGKPTETEKGGLSFRILTTGKETRVQNYVDLDIESWKSGKTPLTLAAKTGNHALVFYLIQRGAELNPSDNRTSPLTWAILGGHERVAKLLLENGADPNDHSNPLGKAMQNELDSIVQLLWPVSCTHHQDSIIVPTVHLNTSHICINVILLKVNVLAVKEKKQQQ